MDDKDKNAIAGLLMFCIGLAAVLASIAIGFFFGVGFGFGAMAVFIIAFVVVVVIGMKKLKRKTDEKTQAD